MAIFIPLTSTIFIYNHLEILPYCLEEGLRCKYIGQIILCFIENASVFLFLWCATHTTILMDKSS